MTTVYKRPVRTLRAQTESSKEIQCELEDLISVIKVWRVLGWNIKDITIETDVKVIVRINRITVTQ